MSRSTPSMTLIARPVWKRTSPIRMNSGIGVREKLITDMMLLRTACPKPGSPPRNSQAPTMLIATKESATGMPINSRAVEPPNRSRAAICHVMTDRPNRLALARSARQLASCSGYRVAAGRTHALSQSLHAEDEFDRDGGKCQRHRHQQPPLRDHQRLDGNGAGQVAGGHHLPAIAHEIERAGEPDYIADPLQHPTHQRWQRAQQDVDADVLPAAQQPRRGEQRYQIKDVLAHLTAPGDAAEPNIAQPDVGADQQRHGQQQRASKKHQDVEQACEAARYPIHRPLLVGAPRRFPYLGLEKNSLSLGPCSGLCLMMPAHAAS